jgi:putative ABC transport system permease protein
MPARFGWYYYRAVYDGEMEDEVPEQTPEMMVLLSAVAAVVGTALGIFFAWGGSEILIGDMLPDASFDPPVLQLIGVVVVAGVAGLVSCVAPSKRATKVSPAEGLALD